MKGAILLYLGAILLYLADAYGAGATPQKRAAYTKWVMWCGENKLERVV